MEVLRALAAFTEPPQDAHHHLADGLEMSRPPTEAEFTQVFILHLYPYASVYLGEEGKLGGEARDRIAGFFRALDVTPPTEPDHLAVLLTAYAQLDGATSTSTDTPPAAGHAAHTLLREHLLSWLPVYLARMAALAPAPYREWADLLADVLHATAARCDTDDVPLPLHLRRASPLADPRTTDVDLTEDLLVPVRTGFILTGSDLKRAARELGLGLRIGERRYVLEQLLGQSVDATLAWLADHARTTTSAVDRWVAVIPRVAAWWRTRADDSAALLRDLAGDAATATAHSLSP